MKFEEASRLLDKIAPGEHLWKKHSHQVAEVAKQLTVALHDRGEKLDLDYMRSCALLHDVGRAKTHGHLHGWTGYVILKNEGAETYSRACIVHWLKDHTEADLLSHKDLSPRFIRDLYQRFDLDQLSVADKVMALSDSLVKHDQVVDLDERYRDLFIRYGKNRWLEEQYRFSKNYQDEVERALGIQVPQLLQPLMKTQKKP